MSRMKSVSILEAFCYDWAMIRKLPLLVFGIVFILALALSLLLFNVDINCRDIIGDGYYMGTDPKPIAIGQSCAHWQFNNESDFTTHTLLSVLLAIALGAVTAGMVWIASWKIKSFIKKFGLILFMFIMTGIAFFIFTFIASRFTEGNINLDKTNGMITALVCLVVSAVVSLASLYLFVKPKMSDTSSKLVR